LRLRNHHLMFKAIFPRPIVMAIPNTKPNARVRKLCRFFSDEDMTASRLNA